MLECLLYFFPSFCFEKYFTHTFSESAFVGFWNTYILLGPLDSVHQSVSKWVDKYTWHWVAETEGYIAQGIVWAII